MNTVDDEDSNTIGRRLREIRNWRGKKLKAVAELAGISEGHLSRIERGLQVVDRRSLIVRLANALQVAPQELTALPVPAPGDGITDAAVHAVRHALMAVNANRPGGQVVPVAVLRGRVQDIRETRRRAEFTEVSAALPDVIRDLHTSIAAGRDVPALLELAVVTHVHVTLMWLRDAGASLDLRWQAATLARDMAREHDEATTLGAAAFGTANALLAAGAFDLAAAELDAVTLPPTTPETAGLVGMVTMTHSLIAAADNRPGDVVAPMEAAAELAESTGEPGGESNDRLGFGFGPTNVGLWNMALALEAGEPDRAVGVAEAVHPERHPYATRQAAYWIDYGRAAAQLRGRRDAAVRAFLTAEDLFPVRVYRNPFARDTVTELLARARRDAGGRELRGMAYRMGVAG